MEYRFGANMRVLRKKMGYSINEMSKLMGSGTTMVSNYERGASEPNLSILIKVSEIFGLSVQDLIDSSELEILSKFENLKNGTNGSQNNIVSHSKTKNISQSQNGGNSSTNEVELLRQQVDFLKSQLKFTQDLLEKAMSK